MSAQLATLPASQVGSSRYRVLPPVAYYCHSGLSNVLSLHHCPACQAIARHPETSSTSFPPQNVHILCLPLTMWHWASIYPQSFSFLTCDVANCWLAPAIHYFFFSFPEHLATHLDISQPILQLDAIRPHSDQWNIRSRNCMVYISSTSHPLKSKLSSLYILFLFSAG